MISNKQKKDGKTKMKKLIKNTIDEIERITENEVRDNAIFVRINLKPGFNAYIIDFDGYFGLSMIIYSNQRMIKYANDYQLHHRNIETKAQLVKYYFDKFNKTIFSIDELTEKPLLNYEDYYAKREFVANHLPCAFDHQSIFGLECEKKEYEEYKKENNNYCECAFAYFKNKDEAEYIQKLHDILQEKYSKMIEDDEQFKKAVIYEMFNHESAIDWDGIGPALSSLGLRYNKLDKHKQSIVDEAFQYVCSHTNY